jgi:hypothetical protein
MIKHNQQGAVSGLAISLIMTVILLFGAIGFGIWAYAERQDYKNNVDAKIEVAAEEARQTEASVKEAEFAEEIKKPLKAYDGPDSLGSLHIDFPKTWSAYVDDSGSGNAVLDGYFAPGVVPSSRDQNSVFALRVQLVDRPYADVLENFAGQQQSGKISVNAYALPKFPNLTGIRLSGQLNNQKNVTMVVVPFRSQTLQIWTEGTQYLSDFDNNILPNFTFSP